MILQALLLVTKPAEPIKGLLTAVHSFVWCCPFLHSPVPLIKFLVTSTAHCKHSSSKSIHANQLLSLAYEQATRGLYSRNYRTVAYRVFWPFCRPTIVGLQSVGPSYVRTLRSRDLNLPLDVYFDPWRAGTSARITLGLPVEFVHPTLTEMKNY